MIPLLKELELKHMHVFVISDQRVAQLLAHQPAIHGTPTAIITLADTLSSRLWRDFGAFCVLCAGEGALMLKCVATVAIKKILNSSGQLG